MKRIKRHKIKTEQPESSYSREHEEHDLAFYIHDRVELMHQVFSVLKYKELRAMAPECVRNLAVGDLQELCTEELLGISSKRLLATLDGAEPPSDTESSSGSNSPHLLETISLDSISSDEEILSQSSKKKKHKRHSKTKSRKREKQKDKDPEESTEVSKASRAGLTVLELLELQARARAIRAQLQNEQVKKPLETAEVRASSDDEVEIKEEEPDVVEISSGDEKPDLATLTLAVQKPAKLKEPSKPKEVQNTEPIKAKEPSKPKESTKSKPKEASKSKEPSTTKEPQLKETDNSDKETPERNTVTRRISDLIITVPQSKTTRKIKLNRNKVTVTVPNAIDNAETRIVVNKPAETDADKKKKSKKKKKKNIDKEGSDHDEITLQLSDSEKMDLLEDLNEKNYEKFSSSDSESSSESEEDAVSTMEANDKDKSNNVSKEEIGEELNKTKERDKDQNSEENTILVITESVDKTNVESQDVENVECENIESQNYLEPITDPVVQSVVLQIETEGCDKENNTSIERSDIDESITKDSTNETLIETQEIAESCIDQEKEVVESNNINGKEIAETNFKGEPSLPKELDSVETNDIEEKQIAIEDAPIIETQTETQELNQAVAQESESESNKEKNLSEGELSDRLSSEVEATDLQPEVVCISDEEKQSSSKKKKKKEKKSKKAKKSKKQDFREGCDQNFYKEADKLSPVVYEETTVDDTDNDDVYEILELSDDSSCYEVEGTVLSKEPTADEIEALSARIDEINQDVMEQKEQTNEESEQETIMSWKDRYLDSKKVKKVLTTANILNALRKKNKELKRRIEEAKKDKGIIEETETVVDKILEEGSIEQYQTLPVGAQYEGAAQVEDTPVEERTVAEKVTKEMKKDAKQLLKIYRKLMNNKKIKKWEKKKKRKMRKKNSGDGQETANAMDVN